MKLHQRAEKYKEGYIHSFIYYIKLSAILAFITLFMGVSVVSASFGDVIGNYRGENAYSNGSTNGVVYPIVRSSWGIQWQCVEYVNRFYNRVMGMGNWTQTGNAYEYWDNYQTKGLERYPNGGSTGPQVNDILVWNSNVGGGSGHVAIVTGVYSDKISIIEQNWNNANPYRDISRTNNTVNSSNLNGWLRKPGSSIPGYVSVSANSISPSPVVLGQNFNVSFTLKEVSGSSKTYEQVAVAILKSDNTLVFDAAMYNNVTIPANGTWSKTVTNSLYATNPAGTYKAVIRGKTGGAWYDFSVTGSGVNPRSFSAVTQPVVPVNNVPAGYLDSANCTSISGWARDPDTQSAINVHVYANGPSGQGTYITSSLASTLRSDLPFTDKNHGYSIAVPTLLKDGAPHSIYVYAIDSAGGNNPLLTGSPKTITCSPVDTIAPTVSIPATTITGQYNNASFSGTASDNVGVTQVTWSSNRGGSGICTGTTNWTANGISLLGGTNIITVTARDAAGNTGSETATINMAGVAFVSSLGYSPSPVVIDNNFNINFTLKELIGAAKTFEQVVVAILRADGTTVFDAATYNNVIIPANGSWSQTVSAKLFASNLPGTYKIIIRGKTSGYNYGDIGTTVGSVNPITFNAIQAPVVDTTSPSVSITAPVTGGAFSTGTNTLNIAGSASDNVGVTQVIWSNNRGGSGTCSGTSSWTANGISLLGGTNIITVTARDAAGNTKATTLTVNLDGYASVSALSLSPSPVVLGQNFNATFTLKEVRGAAKTFEQLAVAILRADGTTVFDAATYNNITIPANGSWSQTATNFLLTSNPPGTYKAMVRGKIGGSWFNFDTSGTGVNPVSFTVTQPVDSTPDAFSFNSQTNVALNTVKTSNSITVTGINTATSISITGGSYSINGGAYTTATGTVNNGAAVTVRLTSSSSYATTTSATLTIGGVSSVFNVTTLATYVINATSSTGGTVVCNTPVIQGASSTCIVTLDSGYQLETFTDNGINKKASVAAGSYSIANVTNNHFIAATFNLIPPTPINGTCGSSKGGTFTAAPATNLCSSGVASAVTGIGPWYWSCDGLYGGGSSPTCSANIQTYAITFKIGGNGTLTGTANQTVNFGASTTQVTAVPATGYHFVNWTGTNGFITTSANPLTVSNVTSAQTITANFVANIAGNPIIALGTASCSKEGTATIPITLTNTPGINIAAVGVDIAYDAVNLTDPAFAKGAASIDAGKTFMSNMLAPGSLRIGVTGLSNPIGDGVLAMVTFICNPSAPSGAYTLINTPQAAAPTGQPANVTGVNGTITVSAILGTCGTSSSGIFATVPSTNLCATGTASTVSGTGPWSWRCAGLYGGGSSPACSANIQTYLITFLIGGNGTLTGTASQTVNFGTSTTQVSAVPATGYHFVNWTGTNGFVTTMTNPLMVSNVTATQTITANFAPDSINGACGASNGQTLAAKPTTNLCRDNALPTVSGAGPWNWKCTGSNGGTEATCSASITIVNAVTIQLPQTGQTTCYDATGTTITCTGTGQDGELKMGVAWPNPRFLDNGDQTVTDKLTGLIWTKNANPAAVTKTWQNALEYIKTLNSSNYLGHNDWRLPNINELKSLVNPGQPVPFIWLNTQGFTDVQADWYGSSSINAANIGDSLGVDMNDGSVGLGDRTTSNFRVWPVRSGLPSSLTLPKTGQATCYDTSGVIITCSSTGQDGDLQAGAVWPIPRFSVNNQTVTDNLTGLVWSKDGNPAASKKTWQEALDYIKTLNSQNYQGYNDWRLPNLREMESLVNLGQPSTSSWLNSQGFSNVQASYLSSTTNAFSSSDAWFVAMDGGKNYYSKTYNYNVWPVRSGQSGNTLKPGDSDGDGSVSIAEVQSAINMFLGVKTAEVCVNQDGVAGVSIAEVQKVINGFLGL